MLAQNSDTCADTASSARGVTFQSKAYDRTVSGFRLKLYDTAGLGEGETGTVATTDVVGNLYSLMCALSGGIDLLIFVIRGPRITSSISRNYKMFHDIFCRKQVPVILVVTGMEDEEDTNKWWEVNKKAFEEELKIDTNTGHACITATCGKGDRYRKEYDISKSEVQRVIATFCESHPGSWIPPDVEGVWYRNVLAEMFEQTFVHSPELYKGIRLAGEQDKSNAKKSANSIWKEKLGKLTTRSKRSD